MGKVAKFFNSWRRWDSTQDNNNRNIWIIPSATDSDKAYTAGDRKKLMRLSRHLYNNLGVTKGIVDDKSRYSVGTGLNVQSLAADNDWADRAEEYFNAVAEHIDLENGLSLEQLCDVWARGEDIDGDIFPVKVMVDEMPKIQTILGHAIEGVGEKEDYVDGIKRDRYGRPVSYLVKNEKVLPAHSVIHIREPRPNTLRGVPGVAHAANNMFDLRDILSFEKQGVKLNSSIAAVLSQAGGTATGNRFAGGGTASVQGDGIITLEQVLGGASIPKIGPADKLDIHRSDKTSTAFQGFLEFLIRDLAVGHGIPYEFAWDVTKAGGPAQRFVMAKAERTFDQRRDRFQPYIKNVWLFVIGDAINRGILPTTDGWWKCSAIWPRKATIDFARDSRERRANILAGITLLEDDIKESGHGDLRAHVNRLKEQKELLAEAGITLGADTQGAPDEKNSQNLENDT
jgi:capsid protein